SHHERWDGKGYPKGLKGEEIPVLARIVAVADTFDAVTSDRFNVAGDRKEQGRAESIPKAVEIIKNGAGSQFDPEMAGLFTSRAVLGVVLENAVRELRFSKPAVDEFLASYSD
ncbi:MAG: HD domain-containing protein, partial [Armatimonadetes bacterium]|nr:HD domain-containing protein [Armatimonadota bacterium]